MPNDDTLTQAVQAADLRDIISRHCPDAQFKGNRVTPVWRNPQTREFNASLKRYSDGTWRVHDWVTNEDYDAFGFLTQKVGLSGSQAANQLIQDAGLEPNRSKPHQPTAQKIKPLESLPEFPLDLLEWHSAAKCLGTVTPVQLDGIGREPLELLATWIGDAMRLQKQRLETLASGADFDLLSDTLMGLKPRICPCGKRWLARLEMTEFNQQFEQYTHTMFGCEPCGEIWKSRELESANLAQALPEPINHVPVRAFNPLAKYQRKMAQLRGAR